MLVTRVRVRGFRNLRDQEVEVGQRVTLLVGPNGAGKTNLLEALYVGLAGRSCRTRADREVIAFDQALARVEVELDERGDRSEFLWSLTRGGERRHLLDAKPAADAADRSSRPPVAVFLPDRLALVKGPPAGRRDHLDRVLSAIWPSRAETRRRYGRALAQRNAMLGRVRAGIASLEALDAWDTELAAAGIEVMQARREAADLLAPEFASAAGELGLAGEASLRYAPRSPAADRDLLAAELAERRSGDVERGYSQHGPHLDELDLTLGGHSVRRYSSQGEQRLALLALLFAERRALLEARGRAPLMLLDDVMSELDPDRRELLARRLAEGDGQALITATEPGHLPGDWDRTQIAMRNGAAACDVAGSAATVPDHAFAA